jgi:hypothetical protein
MAQPVVLLAGSFRPAPNFTEIAAFMITLEGSLSLAIRATFHTLLAHGHDAV